MTDRLDTILGLVSPCGDEVHICRDCRKAIRKAKAAITQLLQEERRDEQRKIWDMAFDEESVDPLLTVKLYLGNELMAALTKEDSNGNK